MIIARTRKHARIKTGFGGKPQVESLETRLVLSTTHLPALTAEAVSHGTTPPTAEFSAQSVHAKASAFKTISGHVLHQATGKGEIGRAHV